MGVLCQICGKEFSNNQNYNRHWKNFHENPKDEDGNPNSRVQCSVCGKQFARKDNLQIHFARVHSVQRNEIYKKKCEVCGKIIDKQNYKRHMILMHSPSVGKIDDKRQFKCTMCESKFRHNSNLTHHYKKVHKLGTINRSNRTIKCPLCSFDTKACTRELMYAHFSNAHSISIDFEVQHFKFLEEFYSWKYNIEKETKTKFISVYTKPDLLIYKCHRSGKYKSTTIKRNLKITGSCKINAFCPAFIKAKIDSDEIIVTYQQTHVGHTNELRHIRLTADERKTIAVQLAKKVPFDDILKGIRCSLSNSPLQRIHLTNRKDIHNIKNSFDLDAIAVEHPFNLNSGVEEQVCLKIDKVEHSFNLNPEVQEHVETEEVEHAGRNNAVEINSEVEIMDTVLDSETVKHDVELNRLDSWVQNLKSSQNTSLVIYKSQGSFDPAFPELEEDDFLLIFMTDEQKNVLIKDSQDIVCIDETDCHNVRLYTLLTPDETREAFPVAFMFTNRGDQLVMSIFFEKIKESVGVLTPKVFISNMEESFYSSWKNIMGDTETMHLYSTWYVLKVWRTNVNNKVKFKQKPNLVYKTLQTLLYELDEGNFHTMLEDYLMNWSEDVDTSEFHEYFHRLFIAENQFKKWAYCFRVNFGFNLNISMESFNRILKYCHIRGEKIKRDEKLFDVLNILRDKLFELIVKINKSKVEMKLVYLRDRHGHSYASDTEYVIKEVDKWQVLNYVSEVYSEVYVVKKVKECNFCLLQCDRCNSCFHEYVCSCADHLVKNNMCKHIHLVARTQKLIHNSSGENGVEISPADDNSMLNEIGVEQITDNDLPLVVRKRKFIDDLKQILEENIETADQLEYVRQECQPIISRLNAPKSTSI